jgi:hypothetical protein
MSAKQYAAHPAVLEPHMIIHGNCHCTNIGNRLARCERNWIADVRF